MSESAGEKSIIEQIQRGEKGEFRHLIKKCNQPLYRTAIAIVRNAVDAEDAIQTTYLKAFLRLDTFRGDSTFLTWVTRILINECKMILRSKRVLTSLDAIDENNTHMTGTNAQSIDSKQMRSWIEAAVMELPEKYRLVYVMRELNEYSTDETVEMLGITQENVKVRLHRAKSLIREKLLKTVSKEELFEFGNDRCERLTERVMISLGTIRAEN